MPSYDPELFNVDPYYDDFDQNKKYLKMLFRPGYALQARELTQVQSILQNQIERFGNFVFDDGSIVFGGQITEIPTKVAYLQSLTGAGVAVGDLNDVIIRTSKSSGLSSLAKVIYGYSEERIEGNRNVIYYQDMVGDGLTEDGNEITVAGSYNGLEFSASLTSITGGMVIFVDEGIRYTNGYFVYHDAQRVGLYNREIVSGEYEYNYFSPDSSVGFNVNRSIVTSEEDVTLKDPANGSYNFNAPGADRYKIDLVINQTALTGSEETAAVDPFSRTDFIEFLRVVDGQVVKKEQYADLGELEDTLARRTYDESGNYIVEPFELSLSENPTNENKLIAKIDPGKAYIFGYEFETQGPVRISDPGIDKARDNTHVVDSGEVNLQQKHGPYILVNFSGISGSCEKFVFGPSGVSSSGYFPILSFDERTGYAGNITVSDEINAVSFVINDFVDIDIFTPGSTLYFSDIDMQGGTSDALVLATIHSVESFSKGISGLDAIETTKITVGPNYEYGYRALSSGGGITFPDGLTSAFSQYSTFYVSGGDTFENADTGYTSQIYESLSSSVFYFPLQSSYGYTGGVFGNIIGNARAKNIQRLSGDIYKLFLTDLNMNSGRSISEIRRIYTGTIGSLASNPIFYTYQYPTQVYDATEDTLIFTSRSQSDVVKEFTKSEFAFDFTRIFQNSTDGDIQVSGTGITFGSELISGYEQWGLNFSTNEAAISILNSGFLTLYDKNGPLNGTYNLRNTGELTTNPQILFVDLDREPEFPLTMVTSHIMKPVASRTKKVTEVTGNQGTIQLSFFSGSGIDEGYWVSYIYNVSAGKYVTDLISLDSLVLSQAEGDIAEQFIVDSGQKDVYYDFAKIKVSKEVRPSLPSTGTFTISYKYFEHGVGAYPFMGAEAYINADNSPMNLEDIPTYTNKNGQLIKLYNAIDFRPTRIGNTTNFLLSSPYENNTTKIKMIAPYSGYDNIVQYDLYTPRIDKVLLNRNKQFEIRKGVPGLNPQAPADDPDAITLYSVVVNPYTLDENDVVITQENNRRYTMRDIGDLEKRIERIEYYSTLNSLEQEAKSYAIYDRYGLEMPKKAILVDQFNNSFSADVLNDDFSVSIDKDKKELKPAYDLFEKSVIGNNGSLTSGVAITGLTFSDNILTFNYTTEEYLSNLNANNSRYVNSNKIVNFVGNLRIKPYTDRWFATDKNPFVKTNFEGENDSWYSQKSFNVNSNFWDYNWYGKELNPTERNFKKVTPERNFNPSNKSMLQTDKIGSFKSSQANIQSTFDRVVEKSITPYIRPKTISFEAKGLKPSTTHYVFFDGNPVNTTGSQSNSITSDEYGVCSGSFQILDNQLKAGKKLVRIIDTNNYDNISSAQSSADAYYYVTGIIKEQDSIGFARPLQTMRESSNSENITTNMVTRTYQRKDSKSKLLKDSLAQIFTVDYDGFKEGIFLKKIDVYFDNWPTTDANRLGSSNEAKLPVRLQLKPVTNGLPVPSKVIAESYVYDIGSDNQAYPTINNFSEDITQVKKVSFLFNYPIYLEPGDYAICLDSNSDKYSVVTYILPSAQINSQLSSKEVKINSLFGSLILPKNVGNTEKIGNEYLTTTLHRCSFASNAGSGTIAITLNSQDASTINDARLNYEAIVTPSCSISSTVLEKTLNPNKTVEVNKSAGGSSPVVTMTLNTTNSVVSPLIDLETLNVVHTKYKLNVFDPIDELRPKNTLSASEENSKYISKSVNLPTAARNVIVRFDKIEPPETQIDVYLKYINPGSSLKMEESGYVRLTPVGQSGLKTSNSEYFTDEYRYEGSLPEFSSFSVKILFSSVNQDIVNYPRIKNLTITAV